MNKHIIFNSLSQGQYEDKLNDNDYNKGKPVKFSCFL